MASELKILEYKLECLFQECPSMTVAPRKPASPLAEQKEMLSLSKPEWYLVVWGQEYLAKYVESNLSGLDYN